MKKLQKELNHSQIHWIDCILGIALVAGCIIVSSRFFSYSVYEIACRLLVLSLCTSYRMILSPLAFTIPILLFFSLIIPKQLLSSYLFLLIPLLPSSKSLHLLSLIAFLFGTLSFSSSILCYCSVVVLIGAYYSSSPLLSCLLLVLFFSSWCFSSHSLDTLTIFVMVILLIHKESVVPILCCYCFLCSIQSIPNIHPWFLVTVGLYFTFLITPTFTFSSLKWSAAFIFTHKTHMALQSISMSFSVFWSFIAISLVRQKQELMKVVRYLILSALVSVVYNTASPVIWSVYTPVLLFLCVLWILLLICYLVCFLEFCYGYRFSSSRLLQYKEVL